MNLVIIIDVGGAKINDDVDDEHDVNDEVYHLQRFGEMSGGGARRLTLQEKTMILILYIAEASDY